MSIALLDVNVLVALVWPAHASTTKFNTGFNSTQKLAGQPVHRLRPPWCGLCRTRHSRSNAVSASDASGLLKANVGHPSHRFWRDEIGFVEAAKALAARIIAHQQITDAHLLGLAVHKKGKLLTLDRGVRSLAGAAMIERGVVEIL